MTRSEQMRGLLAAAFKPLQNPESQHKEAGCCERADRAAVYDAELHRLKAELEEERRNKHEALYRECCRREELVREINLKDKEISELRQKSFARFGNEDCWIYQGDAQDNLESLVCPVVIDPKVLMGLTKASVILRAELSDSLDDYKYLSGLLVDNGLKCWLGIRAEHIEKALNGAAK